MSVVSSSAFGGFPGNDFMNTNKNHAMLSQHGTHSHVLSKYPDGVIYDYNANDGPITNKIKQSSWLIDTNMLQVAAAARSSGDQEKYDATMDRARSQLYKDLLVDATKQKAILERAPYVPPTQALLSKHTLAAAGGDGQILQTAQEVVRQTKYITKVTGVFYRNERFQAVNSVGKMSTEDLTMKGAIDLQLPEALQEIGDEQTPPAIRPFFTTYEKQLFADSIHYGFGMREKSDAFFNIVERMTGKIAGAMLKAKNDKIVKMYNDYNVSGRNSAQTPAWNAYRTGHDIVAVDAAESVEDGVKSLEDFEGDIVFVAPRQVVRAYMRNTQGRNVTSTKSQQPADNRSGRFEFNPEVTYYVENDMTAASYFMAAKDAFLEHWIGPEVDVAYKDQMKPSNWEGRVLFHFNTVVQKVSTAGFRKSAAVVT